MRRSQLLDDQSPFDQGFLSVVRAAFDAGASDIHLEPQGDGSLVVRMRIDGCLMERWRIPDRARADVFLKTFKRQSGCRLSELGVPQDVRFSLATPPCDFRVALVPTLVGSQMREKFVLRLLPQEQDFDLTKYRMPLPAKAALTAALQKRDGVIIVSGPTGSGKTTLLYNALAALDAGASAIYTIEDPVEYTLPGITQCQVDRDRSVGFAQLLRAMMRADPDVLLVGEIRDTETAEAAFHAAKTGHLVMSTVHATNVPQIAERLEDLGVSPHTFKSTTQFASAQRLLPRVCSHCRQPDPEGLEALRAVFPGAEAAFRGMGCEACGGTGTKGRLLVMGWQIRVPSPNGGDQLEHAQSLRASVLHAAEQGDVRVLDAAGL